MSQMYVQRAWATASPGSAAAVLAVAVVAVGVSGWGGVASAADTFSNPAPIVVPLPGPPQGCPPSCPADTADPYPSTIAVSGLSDAVADVKVVLHDLTYAHQGPSDADILLVAPDGTAVMLMSDACGDNSNYHPITSPITLRFDDQAPAQLPADAQCASGTFRPVDDDDDAGEFPFREPDHVPDGPSAPPATLPLSTFNGTTPNGTWQLYVVDDYPNDPDPQGMAGQIAGGWSLEIATATTPSPGAGVAPAPVPAQPDSPDAPAGSDTTSAPSASDTTSAPAASVTAAPDPQAGQAPSLATPVPAAPPGVVALTGPRRATGESDAVGTQAWPLPRVAPLQVVEVADVTDPVLVTGGVAVTAGLVVAMVLAFGPRRRRTASQ